MKIIVILFFLCSFVLYSYAQKSEEPAKLTDSQWNSLFTKITNESWKEAFELSSKYLEELKNDDSAVSIANLRYIVIYSAAGSVSSRTLSYEELEKQLPKVVGKKIATPFHPLGLDCRPPMFNYICKTKESEYDVMTTTTNHNATSILAFEYVKLAKKFDIAKHKEKLATVIGTVDKIVPNPNKSTLVILRIYIKDAEIVLQSDVESRSKK